MSIEIRVLGRDEAEALDRLAPGVFDDPLIPTRTAEFLADPRHHLVVAFADGSVVGFVSAIHYVHPDKPRPELWINEVGVATTHQGKGIGKQLIEAALALARRLDCAEAWVLTDRSNRPAVALYTSAGGKVAPGDGVMFAFALD